MKLSIKQLIAICTVLLVSTAAFSQSGRANIQDSMFRNQKSASAANNPNVKGTPYFDIKFKSASISPQEKVYLIRYNAITDDMEVISEKDTLVLNKDGNTRYVIKQHLGNITFKILAYDDKETIKHGYFVSLTEGDNIALYKKERKKLVKLTAPKIGGSLSSNTGEFRNQKSEFYVEFKRSGTAIKVPRKKKEIIKLLTGKEDIVKKYIKENRIKTSKENDLIKLIKYMNSL